MVLLPRLAEADAGIEQDPAEGRAGRCRKVEGALEEALDVVEDVDRRIGLVPVVHDDDRRARLRHGVRHAGIALQAPDVVDDAGAEPRRLARHLALLVSMEIGASRSADKASSAGTTRLSSSSSGTGTCPGLVDSPPISTIAAPSATIASRAGDRCRGVEWRPPSENKSGVTLRMPMSWGEVFSALRNVSRWRARRSGTMSVGYRLFAAAATAQKPCAAAARRANCWRVRFYNINSV